MAIFHHSVQVISRSSGKTATGAAAYRSAEKIVDERTGITHNYTKKLGVYQSEIITPHLPKVDKAWMMDRTQLWHKVEGKEKRYDAQLVREVNIAIPVELNRQDQISLVRDYVKDSYVDRGMVADINWHDLESNNPHAHVMLTMRELVVTDGKVDFGNKNRTWNDRDLAVTHRQEWAKYANYYLDRAGLDVRIDHRSLAEQGITDRIPQIHLGTDVAAMREKGIPTDRGDEYDRIAEINIKIKAQLERVYQAEADLRDEIVKPPQQSTQSQSRSQSQPDPIIKLPLAPETQPAWKEISTREEQEAHRQMLARHDRRFIADYLPFPPQEQKSPEQEERDRAARLEVTRLANRADNERVRLAREAREEAARQQEVHAAQQRLELPPTIIEVEMPLESVPETYMPTRLELVNWHRASLGDGRHQLEILGQQLKTAYMLQDFMQGQPEPKTLPDEFQSTTVSISLTDKQQFEQKLQMWQQQKRETPLGKFIENVKELAAQDPTGQQTFETMKARRTLEEIAREDPINRAGLKILNKQLISNYVNKTTDAENLNKLVVKLEQIRDNPEHYQNIERQREIERQNDNLRTNTRDRGGRGR
jgi:MobA/MobL family